MTRKWTLIGIAVTTTAVIALASIGSGLMAKRQAPSIDLGEHLVAILACDDCHTPFRMGPDGPEPDTTRRLSGHPQDLVMPRPPRLDDGAWMWVGSATNTAFAGPWGVTYAINLTPHPTTGMGIWTEPMFVEAMRTGRHMGQSRTIQPPMPWVAFSRMTDHELRSVYAYLRTVAPIENLVPDYEDPGGLERFDN